MKLVCRAAPVLVLIIITITLLNSPHDILSDRYIIGSSWQNRKLQNIGEIIAVKRSRVCVPRPPRAPRPPAKRPPYCPPPS